VARAATIQRSDGPYANRTPECCKNGPTRCPTAWLRLHHRQHPRLTWPVADRRCPDTSRLLRFGCTRSWRRSTLPEHPHPVTHRVLEDGGTSATRRGSSSRMPQPPPRNPISQRAGSRTCARADAATPWPALPERWPPSGTAARPFSHKPSVGAIIGNAPARLCIPVPSHFLVCAEMTACDLRTGASYLAPQHPRATLTFYAAVDVLPAPSGPARLAPYGPQAAAHWPSAHARLAPSYQPANAIALKTERACDFLRCQPHHG